MAVKLVEACYVEVRPRRKRFSLGSVAAGAPSSRDALSSEVRIDLFPREGANPAKRGSEETPRRQVVFLVPMLCVAVRGNAYRACLRNWFLFQRSREEEPTVKKYEIIPVLVIAVPPSRDRDHGNRRTQVRPGHEFFSSRAKTRRREEKPGENEFRLPEKILKDRGWKPLRLLKKPPIRRPDEPRIGSGAGIWVQKCLKTLDSSRETRDFAGMTITMILEFVINLPPAFETVS